MGDIALSHNIKSTENEWNNAPHSVSTFLSDLHKILKNKHICPYQFVFDSGIPKIWKQQYNEYNMDSMESCLMKEWNINNSVINTDEYRILSQLSKDDKTGFRIMSILLYSWNTIKVKYDLHSKSWQYILRNKVDKDANDRILQNIHRQNIYRTLNEQMSSSSQWKLNQILDVTEEYFATESKLKFHHIAHANYRNSNRLFPGILSLFKHSRNQFSWHLDENTQSNWHSAQKRDFWKYWNCSLSMNGNVIDKIQNIISKSRDDGVSYKQILQQLNKRKGIPSKQELINGYCH